MRVLDFLRLQKPIGSRLQLLSPNFIKNRFSGSFYITFLFCFASFGISPAFGRQSSNSHSGYSIGAQYTHEFVVDGFVMVREWEVRGDKMKLKDLGMSNYPALRLELSKYFRKNGRIELSLDRYFMKGSATFERNISYNGTLIDGRSGIDVSPTRYYRMSALFSGKLGGGDRIFLQYQAGLLFDHITFFLKGEVRPESTRDEVYERFGRQALPYPFLGVEAKYKTGTLSSLSFELSGSHIPEFRSFYNEGGRIYLQYSAFHTDLSYSWMVSAVELTVGAKMRYMHLFQESEEDTNVLRTLTAGPYTGLVFRF